MTPPVERPPKPQTDEERNQDPCAKCGNERWRHQDQPGWADLLPIEEEWAADMWGEFLDHDFVDVR